ncbi:hypothetical protein HDU91_000980, partial [Kappamyces sp. JEL0680]
MNTTALQSYITSVCNSDCATIIEAGAALLDTGACSGAPKDQYGNSPQDAASIVRVNYAILCVKASDGSFCKVKDAQLIDSLGLKNATVSDAFKNKDYMCRDCIKAELVAASAVKHESAAVAAEQAKEVSAFNALCPSFAINATPQPS